jgi:hypothetical protein
MLICPRGEKKLHILQLPLPYEAAEGAMSNAIGG